MYFNLVTREVDWKPDTQFNIDSATNGAGTSFWNDTGAMLPIKRCKIKESQVKVIRDLLLYRIQASELSDILQCEIQISEFTVVAWTADLQIKSKRRLRLTPK